MMRKFGVQVTVVLPSFVGLRDRELGDDDVVGLRLGFGQRDLAVVEGEQVLVMAADDHVDAGRAGDDHVHVERRVGDGDDDVGALLAQLLGLGAGRVDGGAELDVAGARGDRRVFGGEAEEARS